MNVRYFEDQTKEKIAYVHTPAQNKESLLPAVMFLGGFKSDMQGTKAIYLEEHCIARGQEFLRFDYSGHGLSEGYFTDGTISKWTQNALDILNNIISSDGIILVGSSMGGWISLLIALKKPERIKGIIGIAAAPDFTKDIEQKLTPEQRTHIETNGRLEVPNEYSDEPYIFTKDLLDDGAENRLLNKKHAIKIPITLIQGKQDADVPWQKTIEIQNAFENSHPKTVFIEDGDHRLSRPEDLEQIKSQLIELSK